MPIEIGRLILRFRSSFEPAALGRRVTMQRRRIRAGSTRLALNLIVQLACSSKVKARNVIDCTGEAGSLISV